MHCNLPGAFEAQKLCFAYCGDDLCTCDAKRNANNTIVKYGEHKMLYEIPSEGETQYGVGRYKSFNGRVSYDVTDKLFYGLITGINDIVLFQANCVANIEKAFIETVDDYIETCKEVGKIPGV